VQIADHPGRHQPGTGDLELDRFVERLDELGYDGFVGLEYIPEGPMVDALAWLPMGARG
jgi:hydroxypyruvate isomerase